MIISKMIGKIFMSADIPKLSRTLHEHQSYFYCFFIITFLLENKPDFCEYQRN